LERGNIIRKGCLKLAISYIKTTSNGVKILIAEDEHALSEVVKEEFKAEGFDVNVAKNGEEALSMAKKIHPDAMLLDLIMPKKSGLDVLKEIKEDSALRDMPVIILSNLADDENIKKGLALGAVDYFVKTQHSVYEVIEKVQKYLQKK